MSGPSRREVLTSLASLLAGCGASPLATDDAGADDATSWSDVPDDVDLGPSVSVRFEQRFHFAAKHRVGTGLVQKRGLSG